MVSVNVKMFFDKPNVIKKTDEAERKVLVQQGALTRTVARRSIRKGKGSAAPGNPPKSHTGLLKDRIFFGYDARAKSVVIGPELFKFYNPTIPFLLEAGGTKAYKGRRVVYRKFPYMQPAYDITKDKFPELFSNSVK